MQLIRKLNYKLMIECLEFTLFWSSLLQALHHKIVM